MSKRKEIDFERMAELLILVPHDFIKYMKSNGAKFRKDKNSDDINNAVRKARKNGRGKVEYEIGMLELYLKDVFMKFGVPRNI